MKLVGLGDNIMKLFSRYLFKEMQRVKCGDAFSDPVTIKTDMPQDSFLSPLVVQYLHPILETGRYCKYHLYGVYTQLYLIRFKEINISISQINSGVIRFDG